MQHLAADERRCLDPNDRSHRLGPCALRCGEFRESRDRGEPMLNQNHSSQPKPQRAGAPSDRAARALAQSAWRSSRAVLVGNRAGIVEWANDAWTRLTGFPISETVSKPISHFLEHAQLELELVDFVAQHFREGQPCTLEFPFETFDERTIQVHLEVQPIRSPTGEIDEFVAVATESHPAPGPQPTENREPGQPARRDRPALTYRAADGAAHLAKAAAGDGAAPAEPQNIRRVSVSAIAELSAEQFDRTKNARIHFDVQLGRGLPSIRTHRLLLEELVGQLLAAAFGELDQSWGFVSLTTGLAPLDRRFVSEVHGRTTFLPASGDRAPGVQYIEVHDTGAALSNAALEAIALGVRLADPRTQRLAIAAALAPALGATLCVDSAPGCGTQALLLLPRAPHSAA